eukprot:SAG11_NODE_18997_length_476_cov_0.875332_2_plen_46_part_01
MRCIDRGVLALVCTLIGIPLAATREAEDDEMFEDAPDEFYDPVIAR